MTLQKTPVNRGENQWANQGEHCVAGSMVMVAFTGAHSDEVHCPLEYAVGARVDEQ